MGGLLRKAGANWPRVRALGKQNEPIDTLAQELTNEFWIFLTEHPLVLEYADIQGAGALRRQAIRFLSEYPSRVPPEMAVAKLRQHLLDKIKKALTGCDFQHSGDAYWGLASFPGPAITSVEDDVQRVEAAQPDLAANWQPQRDGQTPPVVADGDLGCHLQRILAIAGVYCRLTDLRDLCWKALRPANPYWTSADMNDEGIEGAASGHLEDDYRDVFIQRALYEHLDGLSVDLKRIVALHNSGLSVRDIERETGTPRSTVSRKLDEVREGVSEVLRSGGYSFVNEADERLLSQTLWDIVSSWQLLSREGDK